MKNSVMNMMKECHNRKHCKGCIYSMERNIGSTHETYVPCDCFRWIFNTNPCDMYDNMVAPIDSLLNWKL